MFAPLARRLRPHSALPVHFSVSLTFRRAAHRRTLCTSLNPVQPPVSERIKTVYPRFERKAMETLNIENEFNFRFILFSLLGTGGLGVVIFWEDLKSFFAGQTADVARQSLGKPEVALTASTFAKEVLQQILVDPAINAKAQEFVVQLLSSPSVKATLQSSLNSLLSSKESLEALQKLTVSLLRSPEVLSQLVSLLTAALADSGTRASVFGFIDSILGDPSLRQQVFTLISTLLKDPGTHDAAARAVSEILKQLLAEDALKERIVAYLTAVLTDERLHKQGGAALWNVVTHSITPTFLKGKEGESSSGVTSSVTVKKHAPVVRPFKSEESNSNSPPADTVTQANVRAM